MAGNTVDLRVRALREARLISQTEAARRAGVSQSWLAHVEAGRRTPSLGNLIALADALSVSLDALCGRTGASPFDEGYRRGTTDAVAAMAASIAAMARERESRGADCRSDKGA